jgi:hypothetical protein
MARTPGRTRAAQADLFEHANAAGANDVSDEELTGILTAPVPSGVSTLYEFTPDDGGPPIYLEKVSAAFMRITAWIDEHER